MWMFGHSGGWELIGLLWMVLFWGAIIALVIWAIYRLAGHPGQGSSSGPTPLDIVKVRYARGEITKEQFEDLKRTLQ